MITIMFTGYSVSDEYIQNTRVDEDETWVIGSLIFDNFKDKWDHPYYNS